MVQYRLYVEDMRVNPIKYSVWFLSAYPIVYKYIKTKICNKDKIIHNLNK